MSSTIRLPKFGLTMEEARVVTWEVSVGQQVGEGDVLAIIETEKVEMELPSPVAGLVAGFLVEPDIEVAVGDPLLLLARDADELAALQTAVKPPS